MSLADAALRALIDTDIQIGLVRKGREVQIPGYIRRRPEKWTVRGDVATAEVEFGPVDAVLEYDGAGLFVRGELIEVLPNPKGEVGRIPSGASLLYKAEITSEEKA